MRIVVHQERLSLAHEPQSPDDGRRLALLREGKQSRRAVRDFIAATLCVEDAPALLDHSFEGVEFAYLGYRARADAWLRAAIARGLVRSRPADWVIDLSLARLLRGARRLGRSPAQAGNRSRALREAIGILDTLRF